MTTEVETSVRVESADVCIIGAGIAGLNALFAASQYLFRERKVILVDRLQRVGALPRRLAATVRFTLTHRRERARQRYALDTVRKRFDVRCGPLPAPTTVGSHKRADDPRNER